MATFGLFSNSKKIFSAVLLSLLLSFSISGAPINPAGSVSAPKKNWKVNEIKRINKAQPMKVFVLDVGQGDSIFIEFPYGETMLVDAGSWDSYGIPHIKIFLDDYFKAHSYKNKTIDVLLSTHSDYDHINGMEKIMSSYSVNWYIDNGQPNKSTTYQNLMKAIKVYDTQNKTDYVAVTEKENDFVKNGFYNFNNIVNFRKADIYILASYKGSGVQDINNTSIVMKIVYESTSILLTGDSEGKNILIQSQYSLTNDDDYEENRIYKRLKNKNNLKMLDADILKVGHHGSRHSATEIYLSIVTPAISVISTGDYTISSKTVTFGHPRLETLQRLDKYTSGKNVAQTIKVYKDKKNGYVNFTTKKDIYLTANEHKLRGGSVSKFGDVVIVMDGKKMNKVK